MDYLESAGSRAGRHSFQLLCPFGLALFGAVLDMDQNGLSSCSLPKVGESLLVIGRCAEAHTRHKDLIVGNEESLGPFLLVRVK